MRRIAAVEVIFEDAFPFVYSREREKKKSLSCFEREIILTIYKDIDRGEEEGGKKRANTGAIEYITVVT